MERNFKWKIDDKVMGIRRSDLLLVSGKINLRGDPKSFAEKENVYKIGAEGNYYGWLLESEIMEFDSLKWEQIVKLYKHRQFVYNKDIIKKELMKIGIISFQNI